MIERGFRGKVSGTRMQCSVRSVFIRKGAGTYKLADLLGEQNFPGQRFSEVRGKSCSVSNSIISAGAVVKSNRIPLV